jgi:crotonobetainyl-CoA:carnitine CoA-transferase CaiB-like acyl-CoA transferase
MLLQGLKVVEHATYIAAPGAAGIMADWGASVIKIEPPGGDPIRRFFETIGAESAGNPVFDLDNRGKRSIVIDTQKPEGRDVIQRLIAQADVFVTNVRPGGLARAGLDYETVSRGNPGLVYASVTGFGLTGPDVDRPGFDIAAFWSRSGMADLMTNKGAEPIQIRTAMGDHITSMATVAGVMAALFERSKTGKGRLVEASLLRAATYALGSDLAIQHVFGRVANNRPRQDAVNPIANFFKTKDEQWLTIVPRQNEHDWPKLCEAAKASHLSQDERFTSFKTRRKNGAALVGLLDEAFAKMTFAEVAKRLDEQDIAWAPVQTPAQAVADPQVIAAGGVVETPLASGGTMKAPGGPLRFPGLDDGPKGPAPGPGADTRQILTEAGFSACDVDALIDNGAVKEGR